MRNSSSRQLVGSVGAAVQVVAPGTPPLGTGISASSAWIVGSLGLMGSWLLGNALPALGLGWPLRVAGCMGQSAMEPLVEFGQRSLKLPWRSANDGTVVTGKRLGTRSRRHSCDQKKNVLCLFVL